MNCPNKTASQIMSTFLVIIKSQQLKINCGLYLLILATAFCGFCLDKTSAQGHQLSVNEDITNLLGKCQYGSAEFDECMKDVFNDFKAYYTTGMSKNIVY